MIPIYFRKEKENAVIPTFGHADNTNAGVDFYACIDRPVWIFPRQSKIIGTGISWHCDVDYMEAFLRFSEEDFNSSDRLYKLGMIVQSRSGLAMNKGLECSNAGVIDEGYTGEIRIKLYNTSNWIKIIYPNDRIAQGVIHLIPMIEVLEYKDEPVRETLRGSKGFGSSGI